MTKYSRLEKTNVTKNISLMHIPYIEPKKAVKSKKVPCNKTYNQVLKLLVTSKEYYLRPSNT